MSIFDEVLDQEHLTVAETKALLEDVETEQAADPDREIQYELARSLEHVNRFATLDPDEASALVEELTDLDHVNEKLAVKITDLLPQSRDELRAVYAQERYELDGDELDAVLDLVAKYA